MKKNKNNLFGLLLLLAIIGIPFLLLYKNKETDKETIITAHRGDSVHAPENTIAAIKMAIDVGTDYVEIDVRQTKDNVIVLMHDSSLKRTTGVDREVKDYTYDELQTLDAGIWFGEEYKETKIPTLQEALLCSSGNVKLNIEIKDCDDYKTVATQVIQSISECNMTDNCIISSTNYSCLQVIEKLDSTIMTGIILEDASIGIDEYEDIDFFSVMFSQVTQDTVDQIHDSGKEIYAWTIDDAPAMLNAQKIGVDNIITNDPELAIAVVK